MKFKGLILYDAGNSDEYSMEVTEAKRIIDEALFMADSSTPAMLQHRVLTQHTSIRVHEAKQLVMQREGVRARAEVEALLRLWGAIDDAVVFRASVILADALMIEAKWEEAEEMRERGRK